MDTAADAFCSGFCFSARGLEGVVRLAGVTFRGIWLLGSGLGRHGGEEEQHERDEEHGAHGGLRMRWCLLGSYNAKCGLGVGQMPGKVSNGGLARLGTTFRPHDFS